MYQIRFRLGLRRDPAGGAHSAPADLPSWILGGPTSKGGRLTLQWNSQGNRFASRRKGYIFTRESSYRFQRVLAIAILSVRLSVCLSVCHAGGLVRSGAR